MVSMPDTGVPRDLTVAVPASRGRPLATMWASNYYGQVCADKLLACGDTAALTEGALHNAHCAVSYH